MKSLFNVNERLSRRNYWYYQFTLFIIGSTLEIFSLLFLKKTLIENNYLNYFFINQEFSIYTFLKILFFLLILVGYLFQARRFVDIGWSKYCALLGFIPLIGIISTGICLIKKGR